MVAAIGFPFRRVHGDGRPELRVAPPHGRESQTLGHDAHHVIGLAIHRKLLPDDIVPAPKGALPESVTQDDDMIVAGRPLVGREAPAELRLHTEDLKGIRETERPSVQRFAGTCQSGARDGDGGDTFEHMVLLLPVPEVGASVGKQSARPAGLRHPDDRQAIRIGIGQGFQQDRIHHTEDGGVCPDAQSQR